MRTLRVLALMDKHHVPPDSLGDPAERDTAPWKMDYDVRTTLQKLGHDVQQLGISDDLGELRRVVDEFKPNICFNLMEEFAGQPAFVQHVVGYLELIKQKYTGCNPRGLVLAQDKALAKKVLSYHRIRVPQFAAFSRGTSKIVRPTRLKFPLLVKSLTEEGSVGIAQSSVVWDDDKLRERVQFIHEHVQTDAMAVEYIEGRELYVAILGNRRLTALPTWELRFTNLPDDAPRIATEKLKWDANYQKKVGLKTEQAVDLPGDLEKSIPRLCKRVYRALSLSGCARIDLRLTPEGEVYVLEANPNPQLARDEDFAQSALAAGIKYDELIQTLLNLGMMYKAEWLV
jgi:D-alanine-D-alanine ligase